MTEAVKQRKQCVVFADVCCHRFATFPTCDSTNHWPRLLAMCLCGSAASDGIWYQRRNNGPILLWIAAPPAFSPVAWTFANTER